MDTETLNCTTKTRIPRWMIDGIRTVARSQHLRAADIQRRAFREYLERELPKVNPPTIPNNPTIPV